MNSSMIVTNLAAIASTYWPVALVWHLVLVLSWVVIERGWRPRRHFAGLLSLLPASVGVVAALSGNPFNALAFVTLAFLLAMLAGRMPPATIVTPSRGARRLGLGLVLFGAVYPHFWSAVHPASHLLTAPLGTLPCPTLAVLTGVTLIAGGFSSRSWGLVIGSFASFYGVFGVFALGVYVDAVLAIGGAFVLAAALAPRPKRTASWLRARAALAPSRLG